MIGFILEIHHLLCPNGQLNLQHTSASGYIRIPLGVLHYPIFCLWEMRVTTASVVFNWIQSRIQPLRRQRNFGFKYEGTEDCSWFSVELMEWTEGLRIIQNIFPNLLSVHYVPTIFRASNPPSQVQYLLIFVFSDYYLNTCTLVWWNFSQSH